MILDLHLEKLLIYIYQVAMESRVDTHVYSGYTIPPNYDSMIAKLITTAQTREEAIDKMKRALDEFVIENKNNYPISQKVNGQ